MAESVLIIGGDSAIGAALAAKLRAESVSLIVTSRKDTQDAIALDMATPEKWPKLPHADVAFLCAAITKLETCENDPEGTKRINVTAMQELATKLFAQRAHIVFLSTSQVFDGTKPYPSADELTSPVNEYGRQKAAFEAWLMAEPYPASVLRLTKVISGRLPILETWSQKLQKGENIEAFTDLVFAPLPIAQVLEGLAYIATHKPHGIFQLSGARDVSYYEIACTLAKHLSVDASRVIPASAAVSGIKPKFLPKHGTLKPSQEFSHITPAEPFAALRL